MKHVSLLTAIIMTPVFAGDLQYQGSIRTRVEAWDWFRGTADNSYTYSGNLIRLGISQNREAFDWQLELAAPFLLGLPNNAIGPGAEGQYGAGATYFAANGRSRNTGMAFLKQGFVRIHNVAGAAGHSLRIGRFEFNDGTELAPKNATLAAVKASRINQRLVGGFGWTHVGRSFDGIHYSAKAGDGNLTVVAATPTRGVFQTDGWGWNQTGMGYFSFTRPLASGKSASELRLLAIYYHDWRDVLKTDNRAVADRRADLTGDVRIATFGGHFLHTAPTPAGPVDFMIWGVGQTGRWGRLDHRAGAVAIEGGLQPAVLPMVKPWLRGGWFHGSGDGNPNDSTHNAFFQILPTPRPFARFPFFDLVNNEDIYAGLTLRPHARFKVSNEFHALRLAERNDLWYLGGGVFQPWSFGYVGRPSGGARGLANLYDTSIDVTLNKRLSLNLYYGFANGRGVVKSIYPRGRNAALGYVELLLKL